MGMYDLHNVGIKNETIACSHRDGDNRSAERAEGARGKAFTCVKRAKIFQLINYLCRRGQLINDVGSMRIYTRQRVCLHYD